EEIESSRSLGPPREWSQPLGGRPSGAPEESAALQASEPAGRIRQGIRHDRLQARDWAPTVCDHHGLAMTHAVDESAELVLGLGDRRGPHEARIARSV